MSRGEITRPDKFFLSFFTVCVEGSEYTAELIDDLRSDWFISDASTRSSIDNCLMVLDMLATLELKDLDKFSFRTQKARVISFFSIETVREHYILCIMSTNIIDFFIVRFISLKQDVTIYPRQVRVLVAHTRSRGIIA